MAFLCNRKHSVRRRLGLQPASMPLLGYFGSIGAGLTVFLLFLNFALEPVKPQPPGQLPTDVGRDVQDRRTTTGLAQPAPGVPDAAAANSQIGLLPEETTAKLTEPSQRQQSAAVQAKPSLPSQRDKRTSGKKRSKARNTDTAWHSFDRPHSGYAQENSWSPHSFPGTLGPH